MKSDWKKYTVFVVLGVVMYFIYTIVFFYVAKSLHIPRASVHYFIYSEFNLIFLGIALFYMSKLIPRKNVSK